MKPRHGAALALVGWYLMVPALQGDKVNVDIPIRYWPHLDSFDSASECRDAGLDNQQRVRTDPTSAPERIKQYALFECIATDDNDLDENLTVESILADIGPALEAANGEKRLELRFDFKDAPNVIRAPRHAVTATIVNLALNAIKFTESGSVKIAMRRADDLGHGEAVEIEISDSGPGLSPALLGALSQPFAQLSRSSTRRYRGRRPRPVGGAV